ncbi:MAG: RsmD family RNA methyltransferase [Flavobacteriales bacterium]
MKERPTTDRAKEGLFNILQNRFDLDTVEVLDLFAGTGSISYEFCSQGSTIVTAVEKDRQLTAFIRDTAEDLGMERLHVRHEDALRFLDQTEGSYDLIFADPPYERMKLYQEVLERVRDRVLLKEGGVLILEHDEGTEPGKGAELQERRSFGNSCFSFFVF